MTPVSLIRRSVALSALLLASPALAQSIAIADPGYATAQATAYVVKSVLENQLGADVRIVESSSVPVIWEALARNGGEIDIWTDVWLPNQQALVEQYAGEGNTVTLSPLSYAGTQGYFITRATAEEYGIRSVYDLSDPEKARIFSPDGQSQGRIWIGAAGWLSTNIEQVRARDYGFAEFFDLQITDEAVATADLDTASRSGGAWVGYFYGPHQNFARYELERLEEPPHDPATWNLVEPSDPNWLANSSIGSAYQDAAIHLAYANSLAEAHPDAAAILDKVQFTTDQVSELAYAIAVEGKSAQQAADEWVAANAELVAGWTVP